MASIERTIKGVNLGGWLVLEPWMTRSLFKDTKAVDEYTYCQQATAAQKRALKQFRDTFITEQDFDWLVEQGIKAVRLPVGYWLFGGEKPYSKTYQYVDMVFEWARDRNIKVLIDLHGAPSSQNGKMHSGQMGATGWHQDTANVTKTISILERIAKRYGQESALLGISLLNEPSPEIPHDILENFYRDAVQAMRPHCADDTWLVFSDNFRPRRWRKRLPGMPMDHHHYQIFSQLDVLLPIWAQILRARLLLPSKLGRYARKHPLLVGEWSLVMRGSKQSKETVVKYGQLQQRAFKGRAVASFYWNYKTERGGLWNFRDCVERGLLKVD